MKALPCIEKLGYGFEGRIYLNHFPKQKRKSDVSFRSWIQLCKNKCFTPKQCHMTKICSGKRCNMYHTTVVYNVLKSNFEYLHSRWKYSHLIRVLFWGSCTLKYQSRTHTRQEHGHADTLQVPKGAHCSAIGRRSDDYRVVFDFCLIVSFNLVEQIALYKWPTRTRGSRNTSIFPRDLYQGMRPAHESHLYNVTTSIIGWAHT